MNKKKKNKKKRKQQLKVLLVFAIIFGSFLLSILGKETAEYTSITTTIILNFNRLFN